MEEKYRKVDYEEKIESICVEMTKAEFQSGLKPDLPDSGLHWRVSTVEHKGNQVIVIYTRNSGKMTLLD